MPLVRILLVITAVELVLLSIAAVTLIGTDRLQLLFRTLRKRLRNVAPSVIILAVVLIVNSVARKLGPELSWIIGLNVTGYIHAIEGGFVTWVQSFATPVLTVYLSSVYVFGYVFVLVFPLLAYLAMEDLRQLRVLVLAYTLNYGVGLLCYIVFIAYGPRNLMPEMVESLLYTTYPAAQILTSEVNTNTNVFPSLHASLSATVAIMAYRTRETYPLWAVVATVLAVSVAVSTMYLGIHWGIDVVAGLLLAVFSVRAGDWLETRWPADARPFRVVRRRIGCGRGKRGD